MRPVRRAADEEVGGLRTPGAGQPFHVGLVAAGSQHDGPGFHDERSSLLIHRGGFEFAVPDFQIRHFRVVKHFDAEFFGSGVIGVDEGLAAAEEKGVRA